MVILIHRQHGHGDTASVHVGRMCSYSQRSGRIKPSLGFGDELSPNVLGMRAAVLTDIRFALQITDIPTVSTR